MSGLRLWLRSVSLNVWSELACLVWGCSVCGGTSGLSLDVWSLWLSGLGLNAPRGAVLSEAVGSELARPVRGCPV